MINSGNIASVHTPFNWRKPLTWISFLIRTITRFYWNHSLIFYKDGENIFVVESDMNGVEMYPIENLNPDKTVRVHQLNHEVEQERIIIRVGKTKYDFRGLLIHGLFKEFFGIWIGPTTEGVQYETFTCCEFIEWILRLPNAYKCNPRDLDDYCVANGSIIFEGKVSELLKKLGKYKIYE